MLLVLLCHREFFFISFLGLTLINMYVPQFEPYAKRKKQNIRFPLSCVFSLSISVPKTNVLRCDGQGKQAFGSIQFVLLSEPYFHLFFLYCLYIIIIIIIKTCARVNQNVCIRLFRYTASCEKPENCAHNGQF